MHNCTVLVNSCDKYEDLWDPFFYLFKKFWGKCPYEVVLNTEKISRDDFPIKVNILNSNNKYWGGRLIDVLNNINTEYVFLLLDDYFLVDNVRSEVIGNCLDLMSVDRNIGSIRFSSSIYEIHQSKNLREYADSGYFHLNKGEWKCNFAPAIWRKDTLLKFLRPWESIWGFEKWGSIRTRRYQEFVLKDSFFDSPVFPIAFSKGNRFASAVVNGKWVLELVDPLFRKHNIQVNYNRLGTMTIEEYYSIKSADVIKKNSLEDVVVKSINVVRSLIF